jgi:hypothetical protein
MTENAHTTQRLLNYTPPPPPDNIVVVDPNQDKSTDTSSPTDTTEQTQEPAQDSTSATSDEVLWGLTKQQLIVYGCTAGGIITILILVLLQWCLPNGLCCRKNTGVHDIKRDA